VGKISGLAISGLTKNLRIQLPLIFGFLPFIFTLYILKIIHVVETG
jgi:hypothetical protein